MSFHLKMTDRRRNIMADQNNLFGDMDAVPEVPRTPKILTAADLGLDVEDILDEEILPSSQQQSRPRQPIVEIESNSYADMDLDSIDHKSIKLDDMSTSSAAAKQAIKSQLRMDEMAMEINAPPKIEDLSNEFKPSYKPKVDVAKPKKSESEMEKERIARELSKVPETINRKESLKLYNQLMDEKRVEKVKKGLLVAVGATVLGVADAYVIYRFLFRDFQYTDVYALCLAIISVFIVVKAKPAKVIANIFFAINTVVLIGPGLIKTMIDSQKISFDQMFFIWLIAIFLSGAVTVILSTSDLLDAYYEVRFDGKKVVYGNQREYTEKK